MMCSGLRYLASLVHIKPIDDVEIRKLFDFFKAVTWVNLLLFWWLTDFSSVDDYKGRIMRSFKDSYLGRSEVNPIAGRLPIIDFGGAKV